MKKISFYLFPIIILLFLSCKRSGVSGPELTFNTILPLSVGNYWVYSSVDYRINEFDSSIIILDSSIVKMEVDKEDTLDSFIGFSIKDYIFLITWDISEILFANKDDGLYIVQRQGFVYPPQPARISKALSYPTFVGETNSFGGYIIKTKSLSELKSVEAGSFNCILFEVFFHDALVGKLWVAPNLGIVKSWRLFGLVIEENELLYYNLQ